MEIIIPLRQHIGGVDKPIVEKGDRVRRGQLIAIPEGLGANIHSSYDGEVLCLLEDSIIIKTDPIQSSDYIKLDKSKEYLEIIKDAGIVGAGGAGFPTHIKLNTSLEDGCVIINAAECEPMLEHNIQRIEKDPQLIIRGLQYVMKITKANKGYIAIKAKNQKALEGLKKAIEGIDNIKVKYLQDVYPAGDERVIIKEILGIKLKPGQLPLEANAVVLNTETTRNIVMAIEEGMPVITKDITVDGRVKSGKKILFDVPIGTPVSKLIDQADGYVEPYGEVLLGGPFTGRPGRKDSPVVKTLGGVLITMPLPEDSRKFGVIGCECGADIDRLKEIVGKMGGQVVESVNCKRMVEVDGRLRCEEPGVCPGQAEQVIHLKNAGAEVIIAGTCEPWTDTVTNVAPRLGVPVYHSTDHTLRSAYHRLYRKMKN